MSRRRVVALFDQEPWPAWSGGSRRFSALVNGLAGAFDTTVVLAPRADDREAERPDDLEVHRFERDTSKARSALQIARHLGDWPIHSGFYRRPAVRRGVAETLGRTNPDAVYVYRIAGAAMVDGLFDRARTVFDLDNAEHLRFATMAETSRGLTRWQHRADVPIIRRWLRRYLPQYGVVLMTSHEDLDAVKRLAPTANFELVPNGADVGARRPDPGGTEILFLGDLNYAPNADGLAWLRAEVLPRIAKELGVVVRVVGRGPIPAGDDIVAVGPVPDLATEWSRVAAIVVPLRAGGGTRLKALDAFAAGVPVVGTSLGVGGLGAEPDSHFLVGDDAESLAAALTRVVTQPATRERLAAAAHTLVKQDFAWEIVQRKLVAATQRVASIAL